MMKGESMRDTIMQVVATLRMVIDILWETELRYGKIGFYNEEIWDLTLQINRIQAWYNKRYPVEG